MIVGLSVILADSVEIPAETQGRVGDNWCRPYGTRSSFPPYPGLTFRANICRRSAAGFEWFLATVLREFQYSCTHVKSDRLGGRRPNRKSPLLAKSARRGAPLAVFIACFAALFGLWQLQAGCGVAVADVFDQVAQERFVVGEFSANNVLANHLAENAAEIFMTRIRHK